MLDKNKFIELMVGLSQMYDKSLSPFALDLYYDLLKDYDYVKIEYAVKQVVKNNKYNSIPKPAEILEYLEGTKDDKALAAWLQVMEAVKKGGYHASVEFADPIIPACVNELGGWMWLNCTQREELPFIEKRFKDIYQLYFKRGIPPPNIRLIGFFEAQNNQKGKEIAPPLRIGFAEITQSEHKLVKIEPRKEKVSALLKETVRKIGGK